jgi:hypothetical protein
LIQANLPVSQSTMIKMDGYRREAHPPFDIRLPAFLPSVESQKWGVAMKYLPSMRRFLKGSGMLYNYKCDHVILVKAQPLEKLVILRRRTVALGVKFCCFNQAGPHDCWAHMEDTVLEKGQTMALHSCRNNSTVSVEAWKQAVQITRWYAGGRANAQQRILQTMRFDTHGLDRKVKILERGQSEREEFKFWKNCVGRPSHGDRAWCL